MIDDKLKDLCTKLKPILGGKADALWLAYTTSDTLQTRTEAESLIHMFAARHLGRDVDTNEILLPPPKPRAAGQGPFYLGLVHYGPHPVCPLYLTRENLMKHVGVFGITGSGKTNVIQNLLLGLLEDGIPWTVIDWKREYAAMRDIGRPKCKEIQVYTVGRESANIFEWNPLRPPPGVHPRTWIAIVAEVLEKSHISGPGVTDVFLELFDKKFEDFGFYEKRGEKYPNFYDALEELEKKKFTGRRMLWRDSCSRILKTFTHCGPASRCFNARNPLRLEHILDECAVIELDMELPKCLRSFISELILRFIHLVRLSQGKCRDIRHFTVLEEVHNLFPKTNIEKGASNSLESIYREIRAMGEGLCSVTQHSSLLPIYILGNCNTLISLGLQHSDDIQSGRRAFFLDRDEEAYFDRLDVGEGIVKIKGRTGPCLVKFPLVPPARAEDGAVGGVA